ncbi:hemerythrin domain-containing protein [Derxia lacustris]|uniref:hemerythrin domain-containing protein n=1 Tax=Derxia lacustris TaxID=764842 RepID=UPI0015940F9F|nr:hemerythrin domain-containing protein [Derxia lacustris]
MDIRDCLKQDHDEVKNLMTQICATDDASDAKKLFRQVKDMLTAHERSEEKVVYTALKKLTDEDEKELGFEGEVEHALADSLVEQLGHGSASTAPWKARAKVLKELLEHHIEEEESDIFDCLEQEFDDAQREKMGAAFVKGKEALLAAHA